MKQKLKNSKMEQMLTSLKPILSHKTMIGYIAARNYRTLNEALTEYHQFKDDLILKYGSDILDDNGNKTGQVGININSPNFKTVVEGLQPYNNIEHDVEIMTAKYKDAIGELSGEEIVILDWMFTDDE